MEHTVLWEARRVSHYFNLEVSGRIGFISITSAPAVSGCWSFKVVFFSFKRNFCHSSSSGWRLKWWEKLQTVDAQLPSTWKGPWRETVCVSQWSYYDWGSGTRPCQSATLTNSISCADLCRCHPFHPSPRPQSSIEHNRYPYCESPRKNWNKLLCHTLVGTDCKTNQFWKLVKSCSEVLESSCNVILCGNWMPEVIIVDRYIWRWHLCQHTTCSGCWAVNSYIPQLQKHPWIPGTVSLGHKNMGKSWSRSKNTSYPSRWAQNVTSLVYISTPK